MYTKAISATTFAAVVAMTLAIATPQQAAAQMVRATDDCTRVVQDIKSGKVVNFPSRCHSTAMEMGVRPASPIGGAKERGPGQGPGFIGRSPSGGSTPPSVPSPTVTNVPSPSGPGYY